jgi:hypothetical protein
MDIDYVKFRARCVDGLPNVKILLVSEEILRVIVIEDCKKFYGFASKRDAKEFIRKKYGIEPNIQKCGSAKRRQQAAPGAAPNSADTATPRRQLKTLP